MRRTGSSAASRSLVLALVLSLLLGPTEVHYATKLNAARLARGEPSLLVGVLHALDRAVFKPVYALDSASPVSVSAEQLRPERNPLDEGVAVVTLSPCPSVSAASRGPKEVIGLYYFRNRYLDPEEGRFVNRDPKGVWGDSGSLGNGYAFCGGDPVNRRDPFGLDESVVIFKGSTQAEVDREVEKFLAEYKASSPFNKGPVHLTPAGGTIGYTAEDIEKVQFAAAIAKSLAKAPTHVGDLEVNPFIKTGGANDPGSIGPPLVYLGMSDAQKQAMAKGVFVTPIVEGFTAAYGSWVYGQSDSWVSYLGNKAEAIGFGFYTGVQAINHVTGPLLVAEDAAGKMISLTMTPGLVTMPVVGPGNPLGLVSETGGLIGPPKLFPNVLPDLAQYTTHEFTLAQAENGLWYAHEAYTGEILLDLPARGRFIYVVAEDFGIDACPATWTTGHSALGGESVMYAGEIRFNNGVIGWWSNESGHYRPAWTTSYQAPFPPAKFTPYFTGR